MKKLGSFVLFSCFLPSLRSVNCPKRSIFYNFVLITAKNLSLLKQFRYMHLKVLITLFQKMLWFIGVWTAVHEILAIKILKKILTHQKFLKNSTTSNTHTTETVSHSIINNINFWKCVTRPLRCIYVNCFNQLRFLAEVSIKLQKIHFLDNLRTITHEERMETRQMTPFFWSTFSNLFVIFTSEFENVQNSFLCGSLVGLFWSSKYIIFWPPGSDSDRSSQFSRK